MTISQKKHPHNVWIDEQFHSRYSNLKLAVSTAVNIGGRARVVSWPMGEVLDYHECRRLWSSWYGRPEIRD